MTLYNDQTLDYQPNSVNLFTIGSSGNDFIYKFLPIQLINEFGSPSSGSVNDSLGLRIFATESLANRYAENDLNLFIYDNVPRNSINLTLFSNPEDFRENSSLNLYTTNYYSRFIDYITWDHYDYGVDIDLDDNAYASLPANNEIRGVDLIGYGACDSDSPQKAIDPPIITHDTLWRDSVCNDGGIFRAINTYTGSGYSGNYYGIRKYEGLLPNSAYNVTMQITTGSTDPIPVPPEWEEWEYGTNNETDFNNVKLIADYPSGVSRNANDQYGYAVAVAKDLLAVGIPNKSIPDESGVLIPLAGAVTLYRRNEDVAGKQAKWEFIDELILPSGYRKDYIGATYENMLCFPDANNCEFSISGQRWNIGQEGRELGYSVDIANSGNRQVIVAGAPKAKWTRQFNDVVISGVPIALFVFTDTFAYDKEKISAISRTVNKWNILYKYFAAPWYAPRNFQPQLDLKLIFCQLVEPGDPAPPVFIDEPWIYHTYLDTPDSSGLMLSGIWDIFRTAFLRNTSLVNNNIPGIIGFFEDNTPSTVFGGAFKPALNNFVQQYLPYSFASGVVSAVNGVALSGHIVSISGVAQQWDIASNDLVNATLDYRNLIASNNLKYITSGVGQQFARSNSYEFQIPPASGGRVYIFENENNKFNLIQAIISPDEQLDKVNAGSNGDNAPSIYGGTFLDMFGQSVAISHDGNVITIGSPYSSESCQIYERKDNENTRMYLKLREWLEFKGLSSHINFYDDLVEISGFEIGARETYYNLSQSEKFSLRSDENFWNVENRGGPITLYQKVFDYSNSDILYTGTWQWFAKEYAGTSRLGWDTDVNDDGSLAIFGAPTDSFNEYDDTNIWYDEVNNTWASYTNAGAVRVFESRNYYPHNLVVEYYKFGNLDRNSHPELEASGAYDQMGNYFAPFNIPFQRTPFAEINIPQEAGLAFIITPEIDAASDEIINRIKEWLILGDRTLVLVGNDPIWEENGLYNKSNKTINKILQKLGSRMRLVVARNQYESLPDCADVTNRKFNITPSFVPEYAHETYVSALNMYAKGVADIKIDLSRDNLENLIIYPSCDEEINPFCEMPIQHLGDLRAQWNERCISNNFEVKYKENWPFHFGNKNPAQRCDLYPSSPNPQINSPNSEPRPILTAAEWLPETIIDVPPRSGCRPFLIPITETISVGEKYWEFAANYIPSSVFSIFEDQTSNISGVFNRLTYGDFVDPPLFADIDQNRDALLQANGTSYTLQSSSGIRKVDEYQTIIAQNNSGRYSKATLIATQFSENYNSFKNINASGDPNYLFYNNLVLNTCGSSGTIAQLGGWTGQTSFTTAYNNSILSNVLKSYSHTVVENYVDSNINLIYNIIWIANPKTKPSAAEIDKIKAWLNADNVALADKNRQLVITYNNNQIIADNVKYICEQLNLDMAPFYSQSEGQYLTSIFGDFRNDPVTLNSGNSLIIGCPNGYEWISSSNISTKVDNFVVSPEAFNNSFIPISGGNRVIFYDKPLNETYWVAPDQFWKIEAESSIEFPTIPGSGYTVIITWVSESENEKYRIRTYSDNAAGPSPDSPPGIVPLPFIGASQNLLEGKDAPVIPHVINVASGNLRATTDYLRIKFDTIEHYKISDNGFVPKTPRILSVSGCLLPIEEYITTEERTVIVGWISGCDPWYEDGYRVFIPGIFRPIMTDDGRYCVAGCPEQNSKEIQDGPIVVAEEFENFSTFPNGNQRSRIVLVSDSTIIQGQCPDYRVESNGGNQRFIRSLYPNSPNGVPGKQFKFSQKLIAPERGSPGKYFAVSGISGVATNFGTGIYGNVGAYTSNENNYNPSMLYRPPDPETYEKRKKKFKTFEDIIIPSYGVFPRLSGVFLDPKIAGGTPDRIKAGLSDLIIDNNNYTGDLFGYSVAIHNDQILVGAVNNGFSKEQPFVWQPPIVSGDFQLNQTGGAGAVFAFQKTFARQNGYNQIVPWEFKQKIKPSSLMAGDQFGYALSADGDFVAIGAPKHDYQTTHQHIYAGSAAFIRKEFTKSFNIPDHIINNYASGYIQDIGAVFTYENKLINWQNKSKKWTLAERINASGYESPKTNDMFGRAVYIDRPRRGDADYTLIVGAPLHDYSTSGNHYTGTLSNAGAAFVYDAMLREQVDSVPNSGSWIKAKTFGASNNPNLELTVYQNTNGVPVSYNAQALVFTNPDGELYLEASGYDPATKGFIAHRPYVEFIKGQLLTGTEESDNINLFIAGEPLSRTMNLTIIGPDKVNVYNSMNLYTTSWTESSGIPLNFTIVGASGVGFSGGLNIVTSGIGEFNSPLSLRIRGK